MVDACAIGYPSPTLERIAGESGEVTATNAELRILVAATTVK